MAAKDQNVDIEGMETLCDRMDASLQSRLELVQLGLNTLLHLCRARARENAQLEAKVLSLVEDLKDMTVERDSLYQKVKAMEAMVQLQKMDLERREDFNSDAMVKWRGASRRIVPSRDAAEGAILRPSLRSEAVGESCTDTPEQPHGVTSPTSVYDQSPLSSLSLGGEGLDDIIPSHSATRSDSEQQRQSERKRSMDSLTGQRHDVSTVSKQSETNRYLRSKKRQRIDVDD